MRKSTLFLLFMALNISLFCLIFVHAHFRQRADLDSLKDKSEMARRLELTDLCLFAEARYTRHPTQADPNTAFQDHPASFEHFPSGSLLMPPERLVRSRENLD